MSVMATRKSERMALDARIKARNRANLEATRLYWALAEAFTPLVGTAVVKNDGGILHKHMKRMPEFPRGGPVTVYRNNSSYSLSWTVKVCISIGDSWGCVYEEATVYVGKMDGNVLTEIDSAFEGRTDFTAEEILEKREAYEVARKAYDDARSALCPFGEHDR